MQRKGETQSRLESLDKDIKDEEARCEKIENELRRLNKAATAVKQK